MTVTRINPEYAPVSHTHPYVPQGNVKCGSVTGVDVPSKSYKDVSVTFPTAFASAPWVFVDVVSTSTSSDLGSFCASAINITSTGFTVRLFNASANQRSPAVRWLAVCV